VFARRNQDRWAADPSLGLYLVADGMGGQNAGELAADIVAHTVPRQIKQRLAGHSRQSDEPFLEQIRRALCELSKTLVEQTRGEVGLEGLGSTVVLLLVCGQEGTVANLGDSRAYLWRQGRLSRLTKDHTVLQILLDRGEVNAAEVVDHPAGHHVTRFVGMPDPPLPDIHTLELEPGDRILLCSDGLSDMLCESTLSELIGGCSDVEVLCETLIASANEAGGADNITALSWRWKMPRPLAVTP